MMKMGRRLQWRAALFVVYLHILNGCQNPQTLFFAAGDALVVGDFAYMVVYKPVFLAKVGRLLDKLGIAR